LRGKCRSRAGAAKTWSGVLATATGLLFYGQPNGGFVAVDQRDGRTLWQFPTNVRMKASPMTFSVGAQQYVVVCGGAQYPLFWFVRKRRTLRMLAISAFTP
jgi:alcohol dehydrogenase (cytochrome c)